MSNPQRNHPVAIVFTFFKLLKDLLIPLVVASVALFRDLEMDGLWLRILIIVGMLAAIALYSWITWYRFTYQTVGDELQTIQGVFVRKKRYISKHRIQSIDLSAGLLHRLFDLVRVEVQTAGNSQGAEAGLKAVSRQEGERLRSELQMQAEDIEESEGEEEEWQRKGTNKGKQISFPVLLLAATTSGGIGVFLSIFTIAGSQLNQMIPDDFFFNAYQWVIHTSIILLVTLAVIGLFIVWLMAIAGTILKYCYFKIYKSSDELRISRGLLEKKQLTIPLKRVQAIRVQENLLRQPLGYAVIYAEIAGGSTDKAEDFSTVLFPMIKKEEINDFIAEYLPEYQWNREWKRLPARSTKRFISRAMFLPLLLAIPFIYFLPGYWWGALIILGGAALLGHLRYRDTGFAETKENLWIRTRLFSRETVLVKRKKIQAFSSTEHYFQRRAELKSIQLAVASHGGAGKSFLVKDMEKSDSDALFNWYSFSRQTNTEMKNGQPAN